MVVSGAPGHRGAGAPGRRDGGTTGRLGARATGVVARDWRGRREAKG
ncbi:MAG: hypothetical protein AVDCRST_MAG49-914 [uncultured Thermomicrobiales bacterium]|uniref:Uncharacterized protein n=1 Tax=uncultured Thermomicrobiales bacterium TaxID=1645740 RepID=A0A6J4U8X1_9BACT|nr:MAG: hypothetical protein AVDCRST_MAG49-914 [uncultured Thermomicrobiales bacterium]